jgi:uncharacterized protein YlzI (FlbEa/FlbD family)
MMVWINVTDPQGHPVWLNAEQLVRVRPCLAGIDYSAPDAKKLDTKKPDAKTPDVKTAGDSKNTSSMALAKSMVDLVTGGVQAVRETQDEIIERIMNAGKMDDTGKPAVA